MKVLQIGYSNVTAPAKSGSRKYTVEVARRLSRRLTLYYERMSTIRTYAKLPIILGKYHDRDVDIVHVLGPDCPYSLIGIFLSLLLGKPLIVTLYAYRFDELCSLNKSMIPNLVQVLLERIAMNVADVVIVTSEWQRRRLPVAIREKAIVAYPGSSMSTGATGAVDRHNNAVCITGSLENDERIMRKGVDLIVEIADLTPQLTFHIVGGRLDQVKNLGRRTPSNLEFHGYLSEPHIRELLSESKFILAPSRHEAFNISVLEGMSCGCIGIVSEHCGIQDILETCGLVLPLRADVFSESMIRLLETQEEADRMRIKGQAVTQEFTWERTADTHAGIYERLCSHVRSAETIELAGDPRLLSVGRFAHCKGIELLVRSMRIIVSGMSGAVLRVVGDSPLGTDETYG